MVMPTTIEAMRKLNKVGLAKRKHEMTTIHIGVGATIWFMNLNFCYSHARIKIMYNPAIPEITNLTVYTNIKELSKLDITEMPVNAVA